MCLQLLHLDSSDYLSECQPEVALPLDQPEDICFFSELVPPSVDRLLISHSALAAAFKKVRYQLAGQVG